MPRSVRLPLGSDCGFSGDRQAVRNRGARVVHAVVVSLDVAAPDLRHLTAGFDQAHGMVCDSLRIPLDAGG